MATIVFSAIGTALGGPLGGALGALVGNQLDKSVFGTGSREGPRLKELGITTSSYGTPIPRHFGRMRAPGSIIWATDLVESKERSGGGKGKPSVTAYSYSSSFAVAVASRPIARIGRIWADGNLLRGSAGDLKTGGELRIYRGHGDQQADPLIASDRAGGCPAFRGLAYCVFESLQLGDFGNRIPALTFEVIADDGSVSLTQMLPGEIAAMEVDRPVDSLKGYSYEGGPVSGSLSVIDQVYPLACDASGNRLRIIPADDLPEAVATLPEPAVDRSGEGFGRSTGSTIRRLPEMREIPSGLRYYDTGRDFQAGLQRADGRARTGRAQIMEFPGALSAADARDLVNRAAERASWSNEGLSWRIAELDPELVPGQVVRVPGKKGLWRVQSWEWRETGVELELEKIPHGPAKVTPADAGASLAQPDLPVTPTQLLAFEVPWDGQGANGERQVIAAASSSSAGWTGAALYGESGGALSPIGTSGRSRSIMGELATSLPASSPHLVQRSTRVEVELVSSDFVLSGATLAGLASGANRAWLGGEIIQFGEATRISGARWRIGKLLRGRGGTESAAQNTHDPGAQFALLDDAPSVLDPVLLGQVRTIAATGIADGEPVLAPIAGIGLTLRPLTPVHPRARILDDGSVELCWTRRSRGAWAWLDAVEIPLNEESEAYRIGVGDPDNPLLSWEASEPRLVIAPQNWASLQSEHAGSAIWARQIGSWSSSDPLHITTIS